MIAKELLLLFKSFSKEDIKSFRRFLQSPYFNMNKRIVRLFNIVIKYYPKFPLRKLSKETLYKKIFNSASYNDSTMRNLYFRLEKLVTSFMMIKNYSRNEFYLKNNLLNELNLRKQNSMFNKHSKSFESQLDEYKGVDNDFFYIKYLFEVNKFNSLNLYDFKTKKEKIQAQTEKLNKATLYLTLFFVTELICNYLNQAVLFNKYSLSEVQNMTSELVKRIDVLGILKLIHGKDDHVYVLDLYFSLFKCFSKFDNAQNYYEYKYKVEKYSKKLSRDEISFHYSRLISYCIYKQKINPYSLEFKHELFSVYNSYLRNEYYKNNKIDYLPHELFRTILFLALDLGEFEWVKNFIDDYSRKVEYQLRNNMFSFGYSFYYYYTGMYDMSLNSINNISKDFFVYRFDARHLLIAINYERGNLEDVLNLIHAYKKSLGEQKVMTDELKESHINYLKFVEKIVLYRYGNRKNEIGFLKEKINKTDNLFQREWLFKKCNLLLNEKGFAAAQV